MTIVEFGSYNEARWMAVSGHSGYAESGKDIVCAGVSITAQSLAAALSQTDGVMCDVNKEEGRMFMVCKHSKQVKRYVDGMFDMARIAFELLAEEYPEYVKVK